MSWFVSLLRTHGEAMRVRKNLSLKKNLLSANTFNSPREANMLRLNAKHIEVLKPDILLMFATEQHSSNPHNVPLIRFTMGLINGKTDQEVCF